MGDDKTEKRIDQIVKGDRISNLLLKKALAICRMTRGPEKIPMLKFKVDGKSLSVRGNHPFPTRSGMKTTFSLSVGDEILVQDKGWQSITSIESVEAGAQAPNVWNIEVDAPGDQWDAHHYVANGVVTGDLMIQVKLQNDARTVQNRLNWWWVAGLQGSVFLC